MTTLINTELPLYSDSYYSYAVPLEGNSYIIELIYNERSQLYFMNLLTADSLPIFEGVAFVPTYPIALDYALFPLTGWFWLEPKETIISEPYKAFPDSIDQYYNFYYSYVKED